MIAIDPSSVFRNYSSELVSVTTFRISTPPCRPLRIQAIPVAILLSMLTAIVDVIALSASAQGFLFTEIAILERDLLFISVLVLLVSGVKTDELDLIVLITVGVR